MRALFQLIDQGNGIIFHRDAAFTFFFGDEVVFAEPEDAGALAWLEIPRRT
jgi:hypothetical protein